MMTELIEPYIIMPLVFTLKFIDDYIDTRIEIIKRKPLFSPIQMKEFYEEILTSHLIAYRNGRTFGITRSELERVARMIVRAQKELMR